MWDTMKMRAKNIYHYNDVSNWDRFWKLRVKSKYVHTCAIKITWKLISVNTTWYDLHITQIARLTQVWLRFTRKQARRRRTNILMVAVSVIFFASWYLINLMTLRMMIVIMTMMAMMAMMAMMTMMTTVTMITDFIEGFPWTCWILGWMCLEELRRPMRLILSFDTCWALVRTKSYRHDICQKIYRIRVFMARILQKTCKSENWQICDKTAWIYKVCVKVYTVCVRFAQH